MVDGCTMVFWMLSSGNVLRMLLSVAKKKKKKAFSADWGQIFRVVSALRFYDAWDVQGFQSLQ